MSCLEVELSPRLGLRKIASNGVSRRFHRLKNRGLAVCISNHRSDAWQGGDKLRLAGPNFISLAMNAEQVAHIVFNAAAFDKMVKDPESVRVIRTIQKDDGTESPMDVGYLTFLTPQVSITEDVLPQPGVHGTKVVVGGTFVAGIVHDSEDTMIDAGAELQAAYSTNVRWTFEHELTRVHVAEANLMNGGTTLLSLLDGTVIFADFRAI